MSEAFKLLIFVIIIINIIGFAYLVPASNGTITVTSQSSNGLPSVGVLTVHNIRVHGKFDGVVIDGVGNLTVGINGGKIIPYKLQANTDIGYLDIGNPKVISELVNMTEVKMIVLSRAHSEHTTSELHTYTNNVDSVVRQIPIIVSYLIIIIIAVSIAVSKLKETYGQTK